MSVSRSALRPQGSWPASGGTGTPTAMAEKTSIELGSAALADIHATGKEVEQQLEARKSDKFNVEVQLVMPRRCRVRSGRHKGRYKKCR